MDGEGVKSPRMAAAVAPGAPAQASDSVGTLNPVLLATGASRFVAEAIPEAQRFPNAGA